MQDEKLKIGNYEFSSRLFVGTGKFPSGSVMKDVVQKSESELVTVALKRVNLKGGDDILQNLSQLKIRLLPNTAGSRTAKEAVYAANLAREALETDLIKLEVHPDPRYLLPDPIETLQAARELVRDGFTVMPYCQADPVLCKHLEEVGCACVMPLAAPIGSNRGLRTLDQLEIIIEQATVPVVIDAGIGAPSHAAQAMEIGADAVLVNTAIAVARDPVSMAAAFCQAVQAGRTAYLAGLGVSTTRSIATSEVESFLSSLDKE